MFALPVKKNFTSDMLQDSQFKATRPGLTNLDINRYLQFKYGRGLYQTSPAPPARRPTVRQ